MGFPCGKYVKVMVPLCLPTMVEAGDVDKPFATAEALAAVGAMSAATIDRYLQPARLDCHGVFGQWALLKWVFTESRDQHDHSTPEIFAGVQR